MELIKERLDAGEVKVSPITGREQLNTSGQTVLFDIFSEAGHHDEPAKPSMTPKEDIPSRWPGFAGLPGIQPLRQGLAQPGSGFAGFPGHLAPMGETPDAGWDFAVRTPYATAIKVKARRASGIPEHGHAR